MVLTGVAAAEANEGSTIVDVMITLEDDSIQRLRIMVDVKAATTPMMVKAIPNMDVVLGSRPFELDLSEYYEKGKGSTQSSAISEYTIATSNVDVVEVAAYRATSTDVVYSTGTTPININTVTSGDTRNMSTALIMIASGAEAGQFAEITVDVTNGDDDVPESEEMAFFVDVVTGVVGISDASFNPGSTGSGSTTEYTVGFKLAADVNTRQDDLVIEFHEDYQLPGKIENTSVAITLTTTLTETVLNSDNVPTETTVRKQVTFTPEDVTVDGEEVFISVGDVDERDDEFEYTLEKEDPMTVLFRQSAGISNPTGAGDYDAILAITFGEW